MRSRIVLVALATVYVVLLAFAVVGVGHYARYGSPLAYVVLGLCGLGVVLNAAVIAGARRWRDAIIGVGGLVLLFTLTLAALMRATGDSL